MHRAPGALPGVLISLERATPLLFVLLLAASGIGILAPAAQAAPYACTNQINDSCPGLVCYGTTTSVPFCVGGVSCTSLSRSTWAAGASWHDCTQVDGYVCTDPTWYGGQGLLGGFVCNEETAFSLP